MKQPGNADCTIIAGPCSVDEHNMKEIYQIAEMEAKGQDGKARRAVAGTRVVGLKSRTELDATGKGMGMDYAEIEHNVKVIAQGGCVADFKTAPSAYVAEEIQKKTGMLVATEVMMPSVQLPSFENRMKPGKFLPWNPSVNQLGWQIMETAMFARRNKWHLGIKNGKWVGEALHIANSVHYSGTTTMEKTWAGLAAYAKPLEGEIVLIHRGVDTPEKGNYRNMPVHQIARRTKQATGAKLYFDPSHAYGPKMKQNIVPAVLEAMNMQISPTQYLYDGILVEVGTSQTDTEQHITLSELEYLIEHLAKFRDLVAPY